MFTPNNPRFTEPYFSSWSMMLRAMLTGMAKPMPMLPPLRDRMALLMPTSSPREVDQRAAGVAGIDGRVGLDEVFVAIRG